VRGWENLKSRLVILDFRAEQDKLELYSTLILVFYLSYHFNDKKTYFDHFLYLKPIIFRTFYNQFVGISCYFVSSLWKLLLCYIKSSQKSLNNPSIRITKHNRDMDPDSIILLKSFESHKSTFKCFLWIINKMKIISINCLVLSAILISCCHDDDGLNY